MWRPIAEAPRDGTWVLVPDADVGIAVPAAFFLALVKRRADVTHLELQRQLHTRLATQPATP